MPEIDIIVARILKLVLSLFAISTSSQNLPANQKVTMLENPRKAKEKIDDNSRLFPQSKLLKIQLSDTCDCVLSAPPHTWRSLTHIGKIFQILPKSLILICISDMSVSSHFDNFVFGCLWQQSYQNITWSFVYFSFRLAHLALQTKTSKIMQLKWQKKQN